MSNTEEKYMAVVELNNSERLSFQVERTECLSETPAFLRIDVVHGDKRGLVYVKLAEVVSISILPT